MRKRNILVMLAIAVVSAISLATLVVDAEARIGGGRSFGSRGSRSFSRPASPNYQQRPSQMQQQRPAAAPYQAASQQSGGFMRSMMGGIAGGLLGGMLFRSLGMAGNGGMGGGGFGLFEFVLLAGIAYMIYRFVQKRRAEAAYAGNSLPGSEPARFEASQPEAAAATAPGCNETDAGISHIRQMDVTFDEQQFCDAAMDMFFRVQGAWMNRDLAPVAVMLAPQIRQALQSDLDALLREKRTNRLENIAVRTVEIAEVWQERGEDFITVKIYANLLDYTVDERTGDVLSGSRTEPVKFNEYWTFTRPVGNNPWRLSAIHQAE